MSIDPNSKQPKIEIEKLTAAVRKMQVNLKSMLDFTKVSFKYESSQYKKTNNKEEKAASAFYKNQIKIQKATLSFYKNISKQLQGVTRAFNIQNKLSGAKKGITQAGKNAASWMKQGIKGIGEGITSTFKKGLGGGFLTNLLKGLGLWALLKEPELIAGIIKSVSDGLTSLGELLNSQSFKDGLKSIGKFLEIVVKFGFDRLNQFLDGITRVAPEFEKIGNAFSLLFQGKFLESWKEFTTSVNWPELGKGLFDVTAGFIGLAAVLAPGATLMVGLKLFGKGLGIAGAALTGSGSITAGALAAGAGLFALGAKLHDWLPPGYTQTQTEITVNERVDQVGLQQSYRELLEEQKNTNWWGNVTGKNQEIEKEIRRLERLASIQGIKLQKGALVPGSGSGDKIPAMLEPGEYVMNREAVKKLGIPNLDKINFGTAPRFQEGGVVEHLHGDPNRPGYDPAHGSQENAHDHFGFSSVEVKNQVRDGLIAMGYTISSEYRAGDPGYHGSDQALDIPWAQFGTGPISETDYERSRQLLADVNSILGGGSMGTYTVSGITYDTASGRPINVPTSDAFTPGLERPETQPSAAPTNPFTELGIFGEMWDVLKPIVNMIPGLSKPSGSNHSDFGGQDRSSGTSKEPNPLGKTQAESIKKMYDLAMGAGFNKSQSKKMAAIGWGESSGNANAHNTKGEDNSYGIYQINMKGALGPERRALFGIGSNEELFKPKVNAMAAKKIFDQQGFNAWGAYGNQNYADAYAISSKFKKGGLVKNKLVDMNSNKLHMQNGGLIKNKLGNLHSNKPKQQNGGMIRGKGIGGPVSPHQQNYNNLDRVQRHRDNHSSPIIINGGGGGGNQAPKTGSANVGPQSAPRMDAYPTSSVAWDYMTRMTMSQITG